MILLLALILRILGIFSSPLWYDEILSLHRTQMPFMDHMQIHVNLWEIMLRLFDTPLAIRIPSLVCSTLAIWLAGKIMQRLNYTPTQWTVSMIMLAAMPGLIWMAQDARYYSGVALIYMASLWFALEGRWLGLFAVSGLAIYVHPVAPAYIVPAWLLIISSAPRRVMLSTLSLPLIWSLSIIHTGSSFWLDRSDLAYLSTQFAMAIGANVSNLFLGLAFLSISLVMGIIHFRPAAWVVFATPLMIMIGVSVFYQPVAFYRTFQPSLMGLALLIGSSIPEERTWYAAPCAILLALMLMHYDPSLHSGHIEQATEKIRAEWQSGDCIEYGDEFSETSASILLNDLPRCTVSQPRAWQITTTPIKAFAFATTDGWNFPTIFFYNP